jgi:hypothetical protein
MSDFAGNLFRAGQREQDELPLPLLFLLHYLAEMFIDDYFSDLL